jgi:hypothetical protein
LAKGQDRDRRLVRKGKRNRGLNHRSGWRGFSGGKADSVDTHRPSNIFEALFAQIVEGEVKPTRNVFLNACRHADTARISQSFETCSDIHAVAENVAVFDDDIANIDAYSKFDAFLGDNPGITLGHGVLNLRRTPQGIDDTGEFDQQAVTGRFDYAAPVFADLRVDNIRPDRP